MFRIDDPLEWAQENNLPLDIQQQIADQLNAPIAQEEEQPAHLALRQFLNPEEFETTPERLAPGDEEDREDEFDFSDFALRAFNRLNPSADMMTNVWRVGTGAVEDLGVELGPFGALNPQANALQNTFNVARWTVNQLAQSEGEETLLGSALQRFITQTTSALGAPIAESAASLGVTGAASTGGIESATGAAAEDVFAALARRAAVALAAFL